MHVHKARALYSISTRFNPYFGWYKVTLTKVMIKSCKRARKCFIYAYVWLHGWANSYTLVHYSHMAISNWFKLTTCFLLLLWSLLPFSNSNFLYILFAYFLNTSYCTYRYTMLLHTILYTLVCMDNVNLVWLMPLLCKTLLQSIWPYTKMGMAMWVWKYVL